MPSGDLISYLSGMRQIWLDTGKKAIVYHRLDMVGSSYEGSIHPYEDEYKQPVCFNRYAFDMMRPLLLSQPYIEDYVVYNGQEHEIDLDKLLIERFTNKPKASLNRWPGYVFLEMATDLSQIWLQMPKQENNLYANKVLINFTQRHRNTFLTYHFLKEHEDKLIFTGLKKEQELFCKEWDLNIPLLEVKDFYDLALAINNCKFYMGNASMCFQIAEALKIPRILECFILMPNVIPIGEYAYDYYHQGAPEYFFNKLLNLK